MEGFAIGIMQGRLSPRENGQLQSFPWQEWSEEFQRAESNGLKYLEWLVDSYDLDKNPLFHLAQKKRIKELSLKYGVKIESVCAHFLIDGSLCTPPDSAMANRGRQALARLSTACAQYGIKSIIVPLMDAASLQAPNASEYFVHNLRSIINEIMCQIALEIDLSAEDSLCLLKLISEPLVGLCYDCGNATALGYDVLKELPVVLPFIQEVHIKDRKLAGANQLMGYGDTPVKGFLEQLHELNYSGRLILETPVGDDWENSIRHNLNYLAS